MTLAVHSSGNGSPLVLLHGWGMNSRVWEPVIDQLESDYHVHRIDLPGHGESDSATATDDLSDWVQTVLASVPENAIWVGWSLGGLIAQAAALAEPEKIRALVAVSSTPCFMRRNNWRSGMGQDVLQQFADELASDSKKTLLRFLGLQVRGAADERTTLKQLRLAMQDSSDLSEQVLRAGLKLLQESDLRSRLHELRVPSLWLFGEKDALVSATTADFIHEALPQAQTQIIPSAGHAPFLSHPQVSIALLQQLEERLAA